MTFDEALAGPLALVGERVEVHVMAAGETPLFVRFEASEETAAISLDREVFEAGIAHEDGAITLQLGGVEFVIARRE